MGTDCKSAAFQLRWFESTRAHQKLQRRKDAGVFLLSETFQSISKGGFEQLRRCRRRQRKNSPVGCCLARGSQSSGMSTKKAPPAGAPFAEPRLDGTGLEQQRSRLQRRRAPPAAEAARSCWGRGQRYASKAQRMLGAATRLPAAETGRRGWGRILIFQGPVKGLRKNQQTQLVRAAHLSYSFCRNVCQESTACRSTVCRASVHAVPDRNNVRQSHS